MILVTEFVYMLLIDLCFLGGLLVLMLIMGMRRQAAFAVMKRNFVGYFSNPTGYVFLCIFVLLTSFAAFWPHEFFTTNLANFDQLNKFLPYIMLVFIPAITMSIWAEEKRQGTDELLLTLPAKDFDIVIGKYFAAVLVFTVSLLFSQLSNYGVLLAMTGGELDTLLLWSTYLGYWFMGVAMLALGMVASFLTHNLTVGFIFGAAFNAPLAFFSNADVIFSSSKWVQRLFEWSLLQRFEPFGRGLVGLPSAFYFVGIAIVGVYFSLILIGRRHWLGGRDGTNMLWHYMARGLLLVITIVSLVVVVQYSALNRIRADISAEKVSTLSESTQKVLAKLSSESDQSPIQIDAFVGNNIPTEYVQAKYDLVNLLREFDVLGGNRVQLNLTQGVQPFSEEAIMAEKRFGIRPTRVVSQSRGAIKNEEVVLGVAVSNGLERVVIPFLEYGMPVEYELIRSINTVAEEKRKTLGIVTTDALINGGSITVQGRRNQIQPLKIVKELANQYDIEIVDAGEPIEIWVKDKNDRPTGRKYDALLVVQPSKMSKTEMTNLIKAIQLGQPTAIFEDPLPNPSNFPPVGNVNYLSGTFFPRQLNRGSSENADIQDLWDALDLQIECDRLPRQNPQTPEYTSVLCWTPDNPYPGDPRLADPEIMVIRSDLSQPRFDGEHPVTRGIEELCFQYTGFMDIVPNSDLLEGFRPLVLSGNAGLIRISDFASARTENDRQTARGALRGVEYTLAAEIKGKSASNDPPASLDFEEPSKSNINVIYVSDIDTLSNYMVDLRNRPIQGGIEYRFQNMAFVLNIIDRLAAEETFSDLRSRKVRHVTLRAVEETTKEAVEEVMNLRNELDKEVQIAEEEFSNEVRTKLEPLIETLQQMDQKRQAGESVDMNKYENTRRWLEQRGEEQNQIFQRRRQELEIERQERLRQIQLTAELKIQEIQRKFKLAAVLIPPIPPLLVGLIVFTRRRLREREGISKTRRLK